MSARLSLLVVFCAIAYSAVAQNAVPAGMTYQGRLTDSNGSPSPDGTGYEIEVRLWTTATGGTTPIWAARYAGVPVKIGGFSLILGSPGGVAIGGAIADLKTVFATAPTTYLGLTVTKNAAGAAVSGAIEILPRQQLFSSPYASRAEVAASVDPGSITGVSIKDGSIGPSHLGANAVTAASVADNVISTNKLSDGAITLSKLASTAQTLGVGQVWQDVTSSRNENTDYFNNTGRSIQVIWSSRENNTQAQSLFQIWVSKDDVPWASNDSRWLLIAEGQTANYDNAAGVISAVIPANCYYRFAFSGTNSTRTRRITELR